MNILTLLRIVLYFNNYMEELIICEVSLGFITIKLCHCLIEAYLFYFIFFLRGGVGDQEGEERVT